MKKILRVVIQKTKNCRQFIGLLPRLKKILHTCDKVIPCRMSTTRVKIKFWAWMCSQYPRKYL